MQYINKFLAIWLVSTLTLFCNLSIADDLEIYYGNSTSQKTFKPNVLFILDTSGSMSKDKDNAERLTRMVRIKTALNTALNTEDINAGLMRFSDIGGPVLYPVKFIDDPVVPEIIKSISKSSDDATQIGDSVFVDLETLTLSRSDNPVITGLRYQDIKIPKGAMITNAYIRFTSTALNVASIPLTFSGELAYNSATFVATDNNLSDRAPARTSVSWTADNQWPSAGETIASPDLRVIIKDIVDQNGWCGGNALSIFIHSGTSSNLPNTSHSFDKSWGLGPQLVIEYEAGAGGCIQDEVSYQVESNDDNFVETGPITLEKPMLLEFNTNSQIGVRFKGIALPPNATIKSAHLEFTAARNSINVGEFEISGHGSNESPKNVIKVDNLGTSWEMDETYQSAPLINLVQGIVNKSSWRLDDDMTFMFSNYSTATVPSPPAIYSFEGSPAKAVSLYITYEGAATSQYSTVRDLLKSKIEQITPDGGTPIVDTLYEAANYYGGRNVDYGKKRGLGVIDEHNMAANTRVSHRSSYTGNDSTLPTGCTSKNLSHSNCAMEKIIDDTASYISPVGDNVCQTNNHIVLLSDGEASSNQSVQKIEDLIGICEDTPNNANEKCGRELVRNLADRDNSIINIPVTTHTIGFLTDDSTNTFLTGLASNGDGRFYTADNAAGLTNVFQSIFRAVKDVNTTFTAPGVSINQQNRLTHNDELYFALFKPTQRANWPGNVKKYRLDGTKIVDANNVDAVDSNTGFFAANATSLWSSSSVEDGNDVLLGGVAHRMSADRNVYLIDDNPDPENVIAQKLHEDNNSITVADLNLGLDNLTTANQILARQNLLKWAIGADVKDENGQGTGGPRQAMGDPIHSQPVIVNYDSNDVMFVSTNQGYLHAFNTTSGDELYAIMPKDLIGNLYKFYSDEPTTSNHIYGLDGDIVVAKFPSTTLGEPDKIYLYMGMRRGGKNYYAFDITEMNRPRFLFKIKGGDDKFQKLGQTWSKPTVTKIKVEGVSTDVLIFGGGYDVAQDNKEVRTFDTLGNAVFIVNAITGERIWWASSTGSAGADFFELSDMKYSIPARISVIDRDNDGFADHMYVADMGGQLLRFDIHNDKTDTSDPLVSGGLLADLGGDISADNRRFYYAPDVTEISMGNEHYFAVALGSGYRAHPLNIVIKDRFYMLKDKSVFTLDSLGVYTVDTISADELYDNTSHALTDSDDAKKAAAAASFDGKKGWYIDLVELEGEKVLASPLILDYRVIFTTYIPAASNKAVCAPPAGTSRVYMVELIDGNAITDLDGDNDLDHADRYAQLKQPGIAPESKILIQDITSPVICLGTECAATVVLNQAVGAPITCGTDFECLAKNIYNYFERVQKGSWKTETQR